MIENATDFANEIETALSTNPYLSSRQLRFENKEGRLVLKGTVDSYFQKQMAQESLRQIDGVNEIENQLEVAS
ncbi:MAG: BON domain-containing protein [Pirellulales bacterium]|jgi:osmotically-inducible protein OsmY